MQWWGYRAHWLHTSLKPALVLDLLGRSPTKTGAWKEPSQAS